MKLNLALIRREWQTHNTNDMKYFFALALDTTIPSFRTFRTFFVVFADRTMIVVMAGRRRSLTSWCRIKIVRDQIHSRVKRELFSCTKDRFNVKLMKWNKQEGKIWYCVSRAQRICTWKRIYNHLSKCSLLESRMRIRYTRLKKWSYLSRVQFTMIFRSLYSTAICRKHLQPKRNELPLCFVATDI